MFDTVAAALGGRRITGLLWWAWIAGTAIGFLATESGPVDHRVSALLILASIIGGLIGLSLIRSLLSPIYRRYSFGLVSVEPPSRSLQIFIRSLPMFCLLPYLFRWYMA
jgi:hypothetical protein